MVPTPQEHGQTEYQLPSDNDGERIVISGMSGLFPKSISVQEFSDLLYNKVDPITTDDQRFTLKHPELVPYSGNVPDVHHFDAQFFKVHFAQAYAMDTMSRKILEHAYQAIYDAGLNSKELSGTNIGVFVGACFSETDKSVVFDNISRTGFGISGCNKSMFANRVSYWLNGKGPSVAVDSLCCSSISALEQAYLAMMHGRCDCAIVAGSYLCIHPQTAINSGRVVPLSKDGKTFSFDERAQGCARSEAINVLFLQKAKNALRIYADVLHVKAEYVGMVKENSSPKFGFYRDLKSTIDFLKTFYKEAGVSSDDIEYFEAFGCASPEVDKVELRAIQELFCKNRDNKPLLIGSVMSNIGYGEAASGLSAVTKVLLGYHNGKLAANLHCGQPRKDIEALHDGRMRILDEHQTFDRSYVAVNGLSVTGVNSHVLLHGHYKPKDLNRYKTSIPHLVTITGRHEIAVKWVHQNLKSNPLDAEQLALLRNIHKTSIAGHVGRGYIILQADGEQKTVTLCEKTDYADLSRRPLWFVYSGMGSQWAGMGTQLMRIPIFATAIERCQQALKPTGLDIIEIITSPDETIFNNILHSFVGIAAVQIGLTDILHAMGLQPDGIIGHSVGELGCAYADSCLTAEEMILSAYYRGLVSLETKFIHGSMAAVGVGYKQISQMCPPEIEVACHNGPDSSTISGPSDVMREFVAKLTADGIFAREVPCSNIAYHSRYIVDAGPGLLNYLQKAIPNPKVRSKRWLSTSVPEARWNEPIAELCSAEYLTNNLLSPVLFEETSLLVPSDAVLVEIAPHGLLQAIITRSLRSCKSIPLTRRKHPDNTLFMLQAIGNLHMEGFNFDVQALYPKVEMPVSTGTPFLSHLVKWAHDEKWPLPIHCEGNKRKGANCDFILALHDKEYSYLRGHIIRGDTLFPLAASLMLVWDTLAMVMGVPKRQMSVEFKNIKSYAQPVLHDGRQLKLSVTIHRGKGAFEILDGISRIATGYIEPKTIKMIDAVMNYPIQTVHFTSEDIIIYQLLRDRDYSYGGEFQSINCANESLSEAMIEWRGNWITFIDAMLQLNTLRQQHNAVSQPTRIRQLIINVKEHTQALLGLPKLDGVVLVKAEVIEKSDFTRCGGVVLTDIKYQHLHPVNDTKMTLKTLTFVPHFQTKLDISSTLEVYLQLVAENLNKDDIKIVGVQSQAEKGSVFKEINNVANNLFGIKVNYQQISGENTMNKNTFKDVDLILFQNLSRNQNVFQRLQGVILQDQFLITEENVSNPNYEQYSKIYRVVSSHLLSEDLSSKNQSVLQLVRWGPKKALTGTTVCIRKKSDIDFLTSVRANLTSDQHLLVISYFPSVPILKELVDSWRRDSTRNKIHLITVNNGNIDDVEKNLRNIEFGFNYVDHGTWGGEFYLSMAETMKESKNVTLQSAKFGNYNSLQWVQAPELAESGVTVNVHYAGITSNDVKYANGSLFPAQNVNTYGMDFSGITERGQPVMGVVRSGAASTQVRAQPELLWPVPAHWSLEDAATVPLAYLQAFYCLGIKVQLIRGSKILVHGGAGALGQAIISIALAHDCEIFTTVSDVHKKQFLLKLFPGLKADHIGKSRDFAFIDTLQKTLEQKKCDVIISTVKGSIKDMTFKCTADFGVFLDISQIQNREDYDFGMSHLSEERNYFCLDFSSIFEPENVDNIKVINQMISDGIARGYVRPLSRISYATDEVPRAFRFLAHNSHRGRVLLRMEDNTIQARYRFSPDHCSLILCNSTTFGVQLADRLVAKGVKLLYVHVQKQSAYVQHKIRSWQELGVKVGISSERLNSQKAIASLLTNAMRLGPLEGVYVTSNDKNNDIYPNLISDLDGETKKINCDLKYFVVTCFGDNSIEKDVCLNRLHHQLPATVVTMPELKSESYNSYPNWRSAVGALESALQNTGVILAYLERGPKPSLLEQIESLTGLSIPENTPKTTTLNQLGIENNKLQLLCAFLRVHYNLGLDEEKLSSLTIEQLLQEERKVIDFGFKDTKGLCTFFNYVDPDVIDATMDMMYLPTFAKGASLRDDDYEPSKVNLCIVPGIEGHYNRFRVLCERLKLPAIVLQPGLDHPYETVREMAERFVKVFLKKIEMDDTFHLLGYESGVSVALEMAAILEDRGLSGKVFCVGCAPHELSDELSIQLAEFENEEQLQNGVLRHIYTLLGGEASTLTEAISQKTCSEKIEAYVRILLGRVAHSEQYARSLMEYAVARFNYMLNYKTYEGRQLSSQIVLLRATLGHAQLQEAVLQKLSKQTVVVHQLDSSLANITSDLRCAAIINDYLDPAILEDFETKNICNAYLLNANTFIDFQC